MKFEIVFLSANSNNHRIVGDAFQQRGSKLTAQYVVPRSTAALRSRGRAGLLDYTSLASMSDQLDAGQDFVLYHNYYRCFPYFVTRYGIKKLQNLFVLDSFNRLVGDRIHQTINSTYLVEISKGVFIRTIILIVQLTLEVT